LEKQKSYPRTIFSADVIREAERAFKGILSQRHEIRPNFRQISRGNEQWTLDSDEEFFAEYRNAAGIDRVKYEKYTDPDPGDYMFTVELEYGTTTIRIKASSRPNIETVFEVYERHALESRIPEPPTPEPPPPPVPTVFIGHGRSSQWRDLKDHLQDQHGYDIEAYEVGARAGHAIRDILSSMLSRSSFAVLVMTGDDETAEGGVRARQNVVHEIGLFQGKLGFNRAIVLVEEDVEVFSNLQGIDQIRYSKNNIKETFGEVLATLRREFS
jgi:predicted nucleotide-binding protein